MKLNSSNHYSSNLGSRTAEPIRRKRRGSCAQRRHRPGLRDVRAARRRAAAADQRHRSADADLARGLLHGPGPPRLPGRPVRQPRHRALNAPDRRTRSGLAHRDASPVRRAVPAGGHGRRRSGGDRRAGLARCSRRRRLPGRDDRAGARHRASRPGAHAYLDHVHTLRPHRDHAHPGGDAGAGAGGRHPGHQPGSGRGGSPDPPVTRSTRRRYAISAGGPSSATPAPDKTTSASAPPSSPPGTGEAHWPACGSPRSSSTATRTR
jgi:hypothetical protein